MATEAMSPLMQSPVQTLDTSGLRCPLPILRAQKALANMASGSILAVISTDPASDQDFAVMAKQMGHRLLHSTVEAGKYYFRLQKQ